MCIRDSCFAIEIDPRYAQVAIERWQNFTGRSAERLRGCRGPAPTPTKLKLLRGETRASRVNRAEPEPGGAPHFPEGMSDASKRVWRRIIRDYGATGVITAADADVLRAYCDAVVRYVQADT